MSSQGPNNAGSATSNNAAGTSAWIDPSYVTGASGSTFAWFDAESSGPSEYLDVTGFGFTIPVGSTILGIQFDVRKLELHAADDIFDALVKALKGGTAVGNDLKSATEWGTSYAYTNYGGAANLLGTTWTVSDINASNFGIRIQAAQSVSSNIGAEGRIEHVRCTVTYTAPAGGLFSLTRLDGLTCSGPANFNRLERRRADPLWIPRRPQILVPAFILGG